jgi:hypothetical protein
LLQLQSLLTEYTNKILVSNKNNTNKNNNNNNNNNNIKNSSNNKRINSISSKIY